ncbi:VOC family protein [Chelativorans sp. AA-79]|uniref:VOC family protein n=1 Tax=Chelativorans sp. AA-79 TaxID=3028735 RepID=UPI0023F866CE|nr:VOC family protein [Chelativorans sp. AA-79]WEX07153.1 VOC family protein [Chelativorans sp. AA-79]
MKLDHCVLPTANLAVTRERLAGLGFTVAPDAAHPFGTANCCVFFEDGTYLEPLAIADENAARDAIADNNTFVLRDRRFREACGEEGFSALALGTVDATSDHVRFVGEHLSAGPPLSFSRPFTDTDGTRSEASFRLAFAALGSCPTFFFTCERVNMPAADRSFLRHHENQVQGISRILATTADLTASEAFLTLLFETEAVGGVWAFSNGLVSLLGPADAGYAYRIDAGDGEDLRLRGIVFRTVSASAIAERLGVAQVVHTMHRGLLVVPPASGQGAYFILEEPERSPADALLSVPIGVPSF